MNISDINYLQQIIEKNDNIELIEIWERVLYVRFKKGRNTFMSKKGLSKNAQGVYINLLTFKNNYARLQSKYHPDLYKKTNEISKSINQWKLFLSECDKRELNRAELNGLIASYRPDTPIFSLKQPISFGYEQETRFFHRYKSSEEEFREETERQRRNEEWLNDQLGRDKAGNKRQYDPLRDMPF